MSFDLTLVMITNITYKDLVKKIKSDNKQSDQSLRKFTHLLLGNGFSISFDRCFRYDKLMTNEVADELGIDRNLTFENAMRIHGDPSSIVDRFIRRISEIHPPYQMFMTKNIESAMNFLEPFTFLFTLNYDLLLYWLLMRVNATYPPTGGRPSTVMDLFSNVNGQVVFSNKKKYYLNSEQRGLALYLHGALHYVKINDTTVKKFTGNYNSSLLEILRNMLSGEQNGLLPNCVTGGTSKQKMYCINNDPYLNHIYYLYLNQCKGNLCTFGWSMNENDSHIYDAIFRNNNLKKIFFGYFSQEDKQRIESLIRNRTENIEGREYYLYDTSRVNIWN